MHTVYLKNGRQFKVTNLGGAEVAPEGEYGVYCYHYWTPLEEGSPKGAFEYDIEKILDENGKEVSLAF